MLYPRSKDDSLQSELFQNPTCEYRGTPFWAWNNKLNEEQLRNEIAQMKQMGLGGYHMHVRAGLATEYMGDEFLHMIAACVDEAKKQDMLAWLYDEDCWPSGYGGGLVTRDPAFRLRSICLAPGEQADALARWALRIENSLLVSCRRLADGEQAGPGEALWSSAVAVQKPRPYYNNYTYVDTMNKQATQKFIEVTHESYAKTIGDEFGKRVPAIFTDEPNYGTAHWLTDANATEPVKLPFTGELPTWYAREYGCDFFDNLPRVLWQCADGNHVLPRWRYFHAITELFAGNFMDTLSQWCEGHNLMQTGHVLEEHGLESQTREVGDCMRSYRRMQLPGIDMLCDWREYTTAKQAGSAARQYGRPGVMSELYGVTNWDFDFRGHKLQGDWQAALGVTVRVQHLTWVSMLGEAKRDYPACIGYQSPWYKEYPMVEDHFARLNTALTRGKAATRIGVVHPVESMWTLWGPESQTRITRNGLDRAFHDIAEWLLFGLMDFDYICEATLPEQCATGGAPLAVGEMAYDAIIVPHAITLRQSTLERLQSFQEQGGLLIFCGDVPGYVDAAPSTAVNALADKAKRVPLDRGALLHALSPVRQVAVYQAGAQSYDQDCHQVGTIGAPVDNLFSQVRQDGDNRWLFLCNGTRPADRDVPQRQDLVVRINGEWTPTLWDTQTGEITSLGADYADGDTFVYWTAYQHDSLLVQLAPGRTANRAAGFASQAAGDTLPAIRGTFDYTLSESNALLLDYAESKFDDGDWRPIEEILRVDNAMRAHVGFPGRHGDDWAQPWVTPAGEPQHTLHLRYTIQSDIAVRGATLAIEDAQKLTITCNGTPVDTTPVGWFVDTDIPTIALPDLPAGQIIIQVAIPFAERTAVEWAYLLGDFGVNVQGTECTIIEKPAKLGFGSWVSQGLPFYAGNVTYHVPFTAPGGALSARVNHFRAPLCTVAVDGGDAQRVAFAPYDVSLGELAKGDHTLHITAFGSRINAFGCVHNADETTVWYGPHCWRTTGDRWQDEYRLWPCGILSAPTLRIEQPAEEGRIAGMNQGRRFTSM